MKIKLMIYLLATSTLSSLQAFKVINKTSEVIFVGSFGYIKNHLKITTSSPSIQVGSRHMIDTSQWANQSFCIVTITANGKNYSFYELCDETKIVFSEDEHGRIIYRIKD